MVLGLLEYLKFKIFLFRRVVRREVRSVGWLVYGRNYLTSLGKSWRHSKVDRVGGKFDLVGDLITTHGNKGGCHTEHPLMQQDTSGWLGIKKQD